MDPGIPGARFTLVIVMQEGALSPHGEFARTQICPLPFHLEVNRMVMHGPVDVPTAPFGNVHWYEVAPGTGSTQ